MNDALRRDIMEIGGDIVSSWRFAKAKDVPHHSKDGSIAVHSLETTGYALLIARWLDRHGVSADERDVVRASLLHDIGMTEDAVFLSPSRIKGRTHPKVGAQIAKDEYGANEVQMEAILYHMWPVCCITPPKSVVGWVVTAADKCCSIHETRLTTMEIVETAGRRLLKLFRSR